MKLKEGHISTNEAMLYAKTSRPAIIEWCKKYKIGTKVAGHWQVHKESLLALLEGEDVFEQFLHDKKYSKKNP